MPLPIMCWEVTPLLKHLSAVPMPLHNVAGDPVTTACPSEFVPV